MEHRHQRDEEDTCIVGPTPRGRGDLIHRLGAKGRGRFWNNAVVKGGTVSSKGP